LAGCNHGNKVGLKQPTFSIKLAEEDCNPGDHSSVFPEISN